MADDADGASADSRGHTRRAILVGAATAGGAGVAAALSSNGGPGNLYGGTMALDQAYQVSDKLWIGPDSAKDTVKHDDGRVYIASDAQVEYYSNGGAWDVLGVGTAQQPVPNVDTVETSIGANSERTVQFDSELDSLVVTENNG